MKRHLAAVFRALLLFWVVAGCATTYDRPTMIESPAINPGDLVPYKRLTRDDFRASHPPQNITKVSRAAICTQIVPSPYARIEITRSQTKGESPKYGATLANPAFYAVANRACSWWNAGSEKEAEILEHEQVHFAITELAARELNRRATEITEKLFSLGNSPAEAIAGIKGDFFVRVRQAFLKQDEQFDEDMARLSASRARQKEWLKKVEARLHDTEVYAAGPSSQTHVARVNRVLNAQGRPLPACRQTKLLASSAFQRSVMVRDTLDRTPLPKDCAPDPELKTAKPGASAVLHAVASNH